MTNNIDLATKLNNLVEMELDLSHLMAGYIDYLDFAQNGPCDNGLVTEISKLKREIGVLSICNLTQHNFTSDQTRCFVNVHETNDEIKDLITFDELPSMGELESRARRIAYLASKTGAKFAMIGGAPFFQGILATHLKSKGITPLFAFSKREVVEKSGEDGAVVKTAVFKHLGWVQG